MSNLLSQPDAARPVSVLLIAEQERVHTTLEPLLRQALPSVRLTWVSQSSQAAAKAQELAPAAVVVDNDLLHEDPVSLLRRLAHELPQSVLLALVEAHDPVAARQSLAAGARAVLTKPLQLADLQANLADLPGEQTTLPDTAPIPTSSPSLPSAPSLTSSLIQSPAQSPTLSPTGGHVIAAVGAKGGVGCTTLVVNTAVALHRLTGQSLLVVEAECAASMLDVALNLLEGPTWSDTLAALTLADSMPEDETAIPWGASHATGIHALPAPLRAGLDAPATAAQAHRLLSELRRRFDWILLDLGVVAGPFAAALLEVADRVLLITVPELPAVRNARAWIDRMAARETAPDSLWVLLNRAGMRGTPAPVDIEERLGLRVRHTVPDDQAATSLSLNRGVPLVVSHPQAAVSRSLGDLAQVLVADVTGGPRQPLPPLRSGPARLLARLWGA